jgi:hypothetical protein
MLMRNVLSLAAAPLVCVALGCSSPDSSPPSAGASGSGAAPSASATGGASGTGGAPMAGNGGSGGSAGSGNAGGGGGTGGGGGSTTNGGSAGGGGGAGPIDSGTARAGSGGAGGARDGGVVTAQDSGPAPEARPPVTAYVPAWPCVVPTWPTPTGTPVTITATRTIAAGTTYDGRMALHNGSGSGDFAKDCSAVGEGAQGTNDPLFILENGATIQNVIVGNHGADGIHCEGTCTVKNVWFQYVCDDEVTAASGSTGTVTIDGGGAKNAHDKLFQDNSHGKFIIQNFYGEKLGKMYRACGVGGACDTTQGNVTLTNVTAVGVDQIVGVTKGRDKATLSKICTYQTPTVCNMYDSSDNALGDGPDPTTCIYKHSDVQVMLNRSTGTFATASACPNYLTSGSSTSPATACLPDLPECIKYCTPGSYGLKACDCTGPGNTYHCGSCAGPSEEPAKTGLGAAKAMSAPACPSTAVKGRACTTEWDICTSAGQYCACVYKPGTLQTAPTVWDCTSAWW